MTEPSTRTEFPARSVLLYASILFLLLVVGHVCGEGDFKVFYTANHQFFHRLNPYNPKLYVEGYPFGLPNSPLAFLIAAPASFFRLSTALSIWDAICLLFWAVSTFLWVAMLWKKPVRFEDFVKMSAACAIAPLYWSFASHQMIFQVLFFASIACWITHRRGSSFWAGMATGAMLMKPHLVAVLALALFLKSRRKWLFCLGTGVALLLPLSPFMHTWRPPSDLSDWNHTLRQFRSEVFYADEQGLAARAISTLKKKVGGIDIRHAGIAPGVLIPAATGEKIFRLKLVSWLLGMGLWGIWWARNQEKSDGELFAITLGWSLLISVYSHLYDALLFMPLVLLALKEASKKWPLSNLFAVFFAVNFGATWLSISTDYFRTVKWQVEGWASAAYFMASLIVILYIRRRTWPEPG